MQTTKLHPTNPQLLDYFDKLRLCLQNQGGMGPRKIANALSIADVEQCDLLDRSQFEAALNYSGVFCDANTISAFISKYGVGADPEMIRYKDFFMDLLRPLSERREHIVEKAYKVLSNGTMSPIPIKLLIEKYQAERHPFVLSGEFTAETVSKLFKEHLQLLSDNSETIDFDIFTKYYLDIGTAIVSDEIFSTIVCNTWALSESDYPVQTDRIKYLTEILIEKVRQKCRPKDICSKILLGICRFYDTGYKNGLKIMEFEAVLHNFGILLENRDLQLLFEFYMDQETNMIIYRGRDNNFLSRLYPDG